MWLSRKASLMLRCGAGLLVSGLTGAPPGMRQASATEMKPKSTPMAISTM
jgi:hypothetical protein